MAFHTSEKAKVREMNLKRVSKLAKKAGRRLRYFGLPSPAMKDIELWREHIAEVFAVEREKRYISHMVTTAASLGLLSNLHYLYGDIDEIVQTKIDQYDNNIEGMFPIDIINLDYCHSLDYQDFKKLDTIEAILKNQEEGLKSLNQSGNFPYFLLFITYNLPKNEGNPAAKNQYLDYLHKQTRHYTNNLRIQIDNAMEWYKSDECPNEYLHKCFLLGRTINYAATLGFRAEPKTVTRYYGDKDAVMLHYQFEIRISNLGTQVPIGNVKDTIDIINFRVFDIQGNDIDATRPYISRS